MYVLAPNQTVEKFPYSIGDLRRDNRNTSFPRNPSEETLADWNVFPVKDRPAPAFDPATENCNQVNPTLENGEWVMTWEVTPASAEEIAERTEAKATGNYQVFWDGLLISTAYQKIRGQACLDLSLNVACTEFMAAMSDAKSGRANKDALQACINLVIAGATLDETDLQELQQLLVAADMNNVYSL